MTHSQIAGLVLISIVVIVAIGIFLWELRGHLRALRLAKSKAAHPAGKGLAR